MRLSFIFLVILGAIAVSCTETDRIGSGSTPTSSIPQHGLLLVSTLDGSLTAIDSDTGRQKWSFNLGAPLLESPRDPLTGFTFIPDPREGQLFVLQDGALEKLPYTVPQLVKASPSRSGKGVLYAGNKKDVWISINPETGHKLDALPPPPASSYCPVGHPENVFIGRIDYQLSMLDSNKKDVQWNASFTDYSSHLLPPDNQYPFAHFSLPNDGEILTYDARNDKVLKTKVSGVIANMYLLKSDGLHLLPHTTISKNLFDAIDQFQDVELIGELYWFAATHRGPGATVDSAEYVPNHDTRLQNMLYVGETQYGLYALSTVVDMDAIPPKSLGPLLTNGPVPQVAVDVDGVRPIVVRPQVSANIHPNMVTYRSAQGEYLLLGYHRAPQFTRSDQMQFTDPSPFSLNYRYLDYNHRNPMVVEPVCRGRNCPTQSKKKPWRIPQQPPNPLGIEYDPDEGYWTRGELVLEMWRGYPLTVMFVAVAIVSLIFATIYLCGRASVQADRLINEASRNSQSRSRAPSTSATDSKAKKSWSVFGKNSQDSRQKIPENSESEEDPSVPVGWRSVGKIQYDPNTVLGVGCEGTMVYKGRFDGREAAVKRILAEVVFNIDREISLLRESDTHPNVIRYFCSESDHNFRFIALELCQCSLKDYILKEESQKSFPEVDIVDMLRQASEGLAHLHQINIVHRDVKPQNILLTRNHRGQARVLISDFGLCKKIRQGQASLSRVSGLAGTEGWIAPECYQEGTSVTCLVDVFSLGCVYFFVLTKGKHPFGDAVRRQGNILKGEYNFGEMASGKTTFDTAAMNLIESMIQLKPKLRPRMSAVLAHPMFWCKERQLQFYMDVSDRIEKEDDTSDVLQRLERYSTRVSRNWHGVICTPLQEDLKKFRTYRSNSIRDLLRALRNKKHHYRELPPDVKASLGDIPNGYVHYWNSRFPRLLMHSYNAMIICSEEPAFASYYPMEAHSFCNRRLEEELDNDFIEAGTGAHLRHTVSTPVLPGSPGKPLRRSPAEAADNWRDGSPAPSASPAPPVQVTPRGPQSANAARKAKKAKKARQALFKTLGELQEQESSPGPDGDANDENSPAEED